MHRIGSSCWHQGPKQRWPPRNGWGRVQKPGSALRCHLPSVPKNTRDTSCAGLVSICSDMQAKGKALAFLVSGLHAVAHRAGIYMLPLTAHSWLVVVSKAGQLRKLDSVSARACISLKVCIPPSHGPHLALHKVDHGPCGQLQVWMHCLPHIQQDLAHLSWPTLH
jgi:hypothetical protein